MSMSTKKEPVPETETSPQTIFEKSNPCLYYTPKSAVCQARAYDFDEGAVTMEHYGGRYHVFLLGEEQDRYSETQMSNPRIAAMLFESCVSVYLGEKIGAYLKKKGYNRLMGCKIDLPCADCKAYGLDTADSWCRFKDGE